MRIVITGAGGQLGRDLQRTLSEHEITPLAHRELEVTDARAVNEAIARIQPELVIHAAALTDTARCEREPDVAYLQNAFGAQCVAAACARAGAAMLYVSTNEVFDGTRAAPYREFDEPHPLNAYGRSKLAGERLVQALLPAHYIVRTAWLYGHGGDNFVAQVLARAAAGELVGVVDEVSTPTWTRDLARAIEQLIQTGVFGVYHLTNAGQASRYEWMREILRMSGHEVTSVRAVTTAQFRAGLAPGVVAPVKPPQSVLANLAAARLGIELRPWREALAEYLSSRD